MAFLALRLDVLLLLGSMTLLSRVRQRYHTRSARDLFKLSEHVYPTFRSQNSEWLVKRFAKAEIKTTLQYTLACHLHSPNRVRNVG